MNHAGVMPIIFASSLLIFPSAFFGYLASSVSVDAPAWWVSTLDFLNINFQMGEYPYIVLEILLIYFFSYFWTTVVFSPEDMAQQRKENGSFIPGLRPRSPDRGIPRDRGRACDPTSVRASWPSSRSSPPWSPSTWRSPSTFRASSAVRVAHRRQRRTGSAADRGQPGDAELQRLHVRRRAWTGRAPHDGPRPAVAG